MSPTFSVPSCTSTVATGPRPSSIWLSMTAAARGAVGIGLEFHDLALQIEDFDQFGDSLAGGGAGADDFGVAAVFDGVQTVGGKLAEDHVGIGIGAVDLVHRHDDRHAGGAGVIDRFDRLRLHAFGGGDDQHDHIGHVRSAGAHGGERLVAGRVDEGDALFAELDHPGGGVLGDSAGFAGGDVGVANLVEQRCLAVVDVAQNRHHRRARN